MKQQRWIPVSSRLPESGRYILLSFDNFSLSVVGRYEGNKMDGGSFYVGDDTETCNKQDLFVNAWMPLPEPYRDGEPKQTNADRIRNMTDEELTVFLCNMMSNREGCYGCPGEQHCHRGHTGIHDWLKEESEG